MRKLALAPLSVLALLSATVAVYAAVARPTFQLVAAPMVQTVGQGASATYTLNVKRVRGFSGAVTVATGTLPKGVVAVWKLPSGKQLAQVRHKKGSPYVLPRGKNLARLVVMAAKTTRLGKLGVVVIARSAKVRRQQTLTLVVRKPGAGDTPPAPVTTLGPAPAAPAPPTPPAPLAAPAPTPTPTPTPSGPPANFANAGDAAGLLPGVSAPLDLRLTNPNTTSMQVTALQVAVAEVTSIPGCSGGANYAAAQYSGAYPLTLPPGATQLSALVPDSSKWPRVQMLETGTVQDVCRGAAVHLDYSGTATS
jgi:hypothetical protein